MNEAINRYPSNAAVLPTKQIMEADALLKKRARRAANSRLFEAFTEAKAKAGDHEAADLLLFVDSGGAA